MHYAIWRYTVRHMAKPTTSTVTANIKAEMARNGYTINDLAQVLAVHRVTAGRILSGKASLSVEQIAAVSKWLRVEPAKIFAEQRASA